MIQNCRENLKEIRTLLILITDEQYQYKSDILSGSTIGQHVRHILEFYTCLMNGQISGNVNYDSRKRNPLVETKVFSAIEVIDSLSARLSGITVDKPIQLVGNYTLSNEGDNQYVISSLNRELAYNLEHAIHHQALIKVGLKEQGLDHLIEHDFGVAPASIRFYSSKKMISYRKQA
ncbi:hypothetical protein BH23BAC2_BH23BAC2_00390 [soil metagenome]